MRARNTNIPPQLPLARGHSTNEDSLQIQPKMPCRCCDLHAVFGCVVWFKVFPVRAGNLYADFTAINQILQYYLKCQQCDDLQSSKLLLAKIISHHTGFSPAEDHSPRSWELNHLFPMTAYISSVHVQQNLLPLE